MSKEPYTGREYDFAERLFTSGRACSIENIAQLLYDYRNQLLPIKDAPLDGFVLGFCPDESIHAEGCWCVVWREESGWVNELGPVRPTKFQHLPIVRK